MNIRNILIHIISWCLMAIFNHNNNNGVEGFSFMTLFGNRYIFSRMRIPHDPDLPYRNRAKYAYKHGQFGENTINSFSHGHGNNQHQQEPAFYFAPFGTEGFERSPEDERNHRRDEEDKKKRDRRKKKVEKDGFR